MVDEVGYRSHEERGLCGGHAAPRGTGDGCTDSVEHASACVKHSVDALSATCALHDERTSTTEREHGQHADAQKPRQHKEEQRCADEKVLRLQPSGQLRHSACTAAKQLCKQQWQHST